MKIPIAAMFEDYTINLQGDRLIDPNGDNASFERPVYVHEAYEGRPRRSDELMGFEVIELYDENPSERGFTVIVSWTDSRPATLIYFPNDQYEVELVVAETDVDRDENGWIIC